MARHRQQTARMTTGSGPWAAKAAAKNAATAKAAAKKEAKKKAAAAKTAAAKEAKKATAAKTAAAKEAKKATAAKTAKQEIKRKDVSEAQTQSVRKRTKREYEIEAIVSARGNPAELKVKWVGYDHSKNTWELEADLPQKVVDEWHARHD